MNATYGTLDKFIDVTSIVLQELVVEDRLKIAATLKFNDLFGDVAPNELKKLIIYKEGAEFVFPEKRNADYDIRFGYAGSLPYWNLPLESKIVETENQQTHFLTYGNQRFVKSLERIGKEARESNFFSGRIITDCKIDDSFAQKFQSILKWPKGGGFWIWKVHVIHRVLSEIEENDILVYCDAGCTINKNGHQKWQTLRKIVNGSKYGIIGFELTHKEAKYTNEKVFQHFRIPKDDIRVRQTPQIMASVIIIRKCDYSKMLVQEWLDTVHKDAYLFTDLYNNFMITDQFYEHRHDQSVFSVLRKIRGCALVPDDTFAHDWTTIADVPFQVTRIRE